MGKMADDERKTIRLKDRSDEAIKEVLAKEAEEGWTPEYHRGGLALLAFAANSYHRTGIIHLSRAMDWREQKEREARIKQEINEPTPPFTNKKAAQLWRSLEKLQRRIQGLEQRAKDLRTSIETECSQCTHDWKYAGYSQGFPVKVCKKCGKSEMDPTIL